MLKRIHLFLLATLLALLTLMPSVALAAYTPKSATVTTTGDQTVAGVKTYTDRGLYIGTAGSTNAEILWKGTVSDDATAAVEIRNMVTTNATFDPGIVFTGNTARAAGTMRFDATTDTGGVGAGVVNARLAAGSALTTRPIMTWQNNATQVMSLTAAGGLIITGGTTPSFRVGASGTTITQMRVYTQSLDVASVAANSTAEQTFTVTGLTTSDKVFVSKPSHTSGLILSTARVSATDTLAITFGNLSAGAIDPAAETYQITTIRS